MTRTLLLVEDNPSDQKLTLRALSRSGVDVEVAVANDGVEALEYLLGTGSHAAAPPDLPALVLLDLQMPRLDGSEVLRQMRSSERTRLCPVVVLTASREAEDVARCYQRGANAYLRKPLDLAEFGEVARTVSHFWLQLNQLPPLSVLPPATGGPGSTEIP